MRPHVDMHACTSFRIGPGPQFLHVYVVGNVCSATISVSVDVLQLAVMPLVAVVGCCGLSIVGACVSTYQCVYLSVWPRACVVV